MGHGGAVESPGNRWKSLEAPAGTLARMAVRLDIETIVGGHVLVTSGQTLTTYLRYLGAHIDAVRAAIRAGKTLDETLASLPLEEAYLPPEGSPLAQLRPVMQGVYLWNVKKTYLELNGQ